MLLEYGMTEEKLVRAIVADPMNSAIATCMSTTNICTTHYVLKEKHQDASNRLTTLTARNKELATEKI